ncbi:hypothetical protein [Streptomyces sp. NPDC001089]
MDYANRLRVIAGPRPHAELQWSSTSDFPLLIWGQYQQDGAVGELGWWLHFTDRDGAGQTRAIMGGQQDEARATAQARQILLNSL